jgi:hypothetical protein
MSIKVVDVTIPSSTAGEGERGRREAKISLEDIPPNTAATVGNYTIVIIEVHKLELPWSKEYIVACRLKDGDYTSPLFHVYCKDADDFKAKVAEEIRRYETAKLAGVRP